MPDLSAYLNVYNTALVVIERKGWALRFEENGEHWFASKDGWELLAEDPMQLLGLISIHEHLAPTKKEDYWWKLDQPDLFSELDSRVR